jgi:glycosyltransferase involved in cell wall biosynthesis
MTTAPRPVLVVSNHGEIVGGGEISLLTLLKGLDRACWAPEVVIPSEGPVAACARALGLPTHTIPLPPLRRPWAAIRQTMVPMRRLVQDSGALLLHANGSRAMFYAGLVGRLLGRPVIWHVRIADRDPVLDRLLIPLAGAIVVNSKAVGRRFARASCKVRCIPNGVDLARFAPRPASPTLRASLGLPGGAPVVASVGRFVAFKGYNHLLEAARLVCEAAPNTHWLLVGDGELRGDLESHCRRLGLEQRVRFAGWREDVPEILALADLFVLPSLGEHFGRVLIEAMAMGKAVVATDAGGVPEVVLNRETGLLVPPAQPEALAAAVLALLRDPARARRLGEAGRLRAEAEFGLARHVEAVEVLYEELLGESRADV